MEKQHLIHGSFFLQMWVMILLTSCSGLTWAERPGWIERQLVEPTSTELISPVSLWVWPGTDAENRYLEQRLAAFHAQYPAVDVELTLVSNYGRRLRTALAGDNPPDILYLNLSQLPDLVDNELLAPLLSMPR